MNVRFGFCLAIAAATVFSALPASAEVRTTRAATGADRVIIEVNGMTMTQRQFKEQFDREWTEFSAQQNIAANDPSAEEMKSRLAMRLMDNVIERYMFITFAKKEGVRVTRDSVQAEIDKIIATYPSAAFFDSALKEAGRTREELRKRIEDELAIRGYLMKSLNTTPATESEARAFYSQNRARFSQPAMVHARHILISDDTNSQRTLQEIRRKLDSGESFALLAKQYSKCPSAMNGGDLGFFGKGRMVPEFEQSAFSLPIGKVSDPVKSEFGWHIIKIDEREEERILDFNEVKDRIVDLLTERKNETEVQKLSLKLRLLSTIKITGPVL